MTATKFPTTKLPIAAPNAVAHIDGSVDCTLLRVGVLNIVSATPVASFLVRSGVQQHPVWALERLAVVVYCYCQAVKAETLATELPVIEVSVQASLVSGRKLAALVAFDIHWHTSRAIRDRAEPMIARMTGDHARWKDRWPTEPIEFPVKR